jgi:hypothetical protein
MALQVRTCKSHLMKKALTQAKPGKGFFCFMVTPWKSAAGRSLGGNLLTPPICLVAFDLHTTLSDTVF